MNDNLDNGPSKQLSITIEEEVVSRRIVLKRALTFGCGVMLPIVLMGCDSKESAGSASTPPAPSGTANRNTDSPAAPSSTSDTMMTDSPATVSTPEAGAGSPAAATAPGKVSQASVRYQDMPNGDQKCSGCALFVEPNACSVVEGIISPEGWCSIWAPKAS